MSAKKNDDKSFSLDRKKYYLDNEFHKNIKENYFLYLLFQKYITKLTFCIHLSIKPKQFL